MSAFRESYRLTEVMQAAPAVAQLPADAVWKNALHMERCPTDGRRDEIDEQWHWRDLEQNAHNLHRTRNLERRP